jgi:murein DD-endopeptidase MepM/ murein hydrolase activator NlpD
MALGPRTRVLLIAMAAFAALAAPVWYMSSAYWSQPVRPLPTPRPDAEQPSQTPTTEATTTPDAVPQTEAAAEPSASDATPSPTSTPTPGASSQTPGTSGGAPSALSSMHLLIPVEGVRPESLRDTFDDARSEGRVHDAIDIPAPRNTPVYASTDGRIVKLFQSAKGGTTIYQVASTDEHFVLYYAHLDHYAEGLADGHVARRGETIGYVGDTGDAGPGNTHLHFQIYRVADPKHFWTGEDINPYPLLRSTQ